MEISIIIPVYNTPLEILLRCIKSVENIKNISYELIIINDGSSDELTKEYSQLESKIIKIYNKKNGGVSSARNYGIKIAKGNYVMFVDSDDVIFPDVLKSEDLEKNYDIIFYNESVVNDNNKMIVQKELNKISGNVQSKDILKEFITSSSFHSPCSKLYKKEIITNNSISFNENMIQAEDAIFNLSFLKTNPSCLYVDETLYGYYYKITNSQNRLKKDSRKRISNAYYLFDEIFKLYTESFSDDMNIFKQINVRYIKSMFTICTEILNIRLEEKNELLDDISNNIMKYFDKKIKYPKSILVKQLIIKNKMWFLVKVLSVFRNIKIIMKKGLLSCKFI